MDFDKATKKRIYRRGLKVIALLDYTEEGRKAVSGRFKRFLHEMVTLDAWKAVLSKTPLESAMTKVVRGRKRDPGSFVLDLVVIDVWSRHLGSTMHDDPGLGSLAFNSFCLEQLSLLGLPEDYCQMISVSFIRIPEW